MDHEYINLLKSSLEKNNVEVKLLKPFHYAAIINILALIFYRFRGYRLAHIHWLYIFPCSFVMKLFYILCKSLKITIIWEMHNIVSHSATMQDYKISKWFYENVDAIIYHSQDDIQRAKSELQTNVDKLHIVVPHGNFNNSYENNISKIDARKALDIDVKSRVVLCFGAIRKNRGYEYLIEAIKTLNNTVALIVGKIQDKDVYYILQQYAKINNNIKLIAKTKWIPDHDIQYFFNACDVVVLPYTDITTSGVIPLSYAFSKPVITTAIGGIKDIVNSDVGILVPPCDSIELRNAIENIFRLDIETMGKNAYVYSQEAFNWDKNSQKINIFYESLLEN
ncbi:putative glycosyltransferase [Geobacter sp. OR-1]|nr:putative glycosyltransferase [Geobacter sp. OR-1]